MKVRGALILSVFLMLSLFFSISGVHAITSCPSDNSDCDACNNIIANAGAGEEIKLSLDLVNTSGRCLVLPSTLNNGIVINCDGKTITGGGSGSGIEVYKSVTIKNCNISGFGTGIYLLPGSSGTTINYSNTSYNTHGVFVGTDSNWIETNIITHNTYGVRMATGVTNNNLYNNYFDNTQNVWFLSPVAQNYWVTSNKTGPNIIGGPYIIGNYWSSYTPTKDDDDNGMDDGQYTLASQNIDTSPLVYDIFAPLLSYDEPPTPEDGSTVYSEPVTLQVSSNEELGECTFRIQNIDYPGTIDGTVCSLDFYSTEVVLYHYNAIIKDTDGNSNQSLIDNERTFRIDLNGFAFDFVSPSPQDGNYSAEASYTINASTTDGTALSSCTLEWNGTNESVAPTGDYCQITKSSLPDSVYTFTMYAEDVNERESSTETRTARIDTILDISYVSPSPSNNSIVGKDWAYIKVSSPEIPLSSCTLTFNGTQETMYVIGNDCYINKTSLPDLTNYILNVTATDILGKTNTTGDLKFRTDTTGPVIDVHTASPSTVGEGENITITISASDDDGIDEVWVVVTLPDDTEETLEISNGGSVEYEAALSGTYTITFYARDNAGSVTTISQGVHVNPLIQFTSLTQFFNQSFPSKIEFFDPSSGEMIKSFTSSDGNFTNKEIVGVTYNIKLTTFNDTFMIKLMGVNTSLQSGKTLKLDWLDTPAEGFEYTYAVENPYTITSGVIGIFYDDDNFGSESTIEMYRCAQWNFAQRLCTGSWSKVNATVYTSGDYIEASVTGFSAFSLKQGAFCGNGECEEGESPVNCATDCTCVPGTTRSCAVSHQGICAVGEETCNSEGVWSGCPQPQTELCNMMDDDCDGVIDDVSGGTSVQSTHCGCYGGAYSSDETCNGIDDDCDGKIDDGGNCCKIGDKKQCGTSSMIGICSPGVAYCDDGIWGECVGAVTPVSEICGNGLDDNCDGVVDDGCRTYTQCDDGKIPYTGCICEGEVTDYGYCCGNLIYFDGCPSSSNWWILVAIGAIVLITLYIAMTYLKSKGKDLSWETLTGKYKKTESFAPTESEYGNKLSSEKDMEEYLMEKSDINEQPDVFDELKKRDKEKK